MGKRPTGTPSGKGGKATVSNDSISKAKQSLATTIVAIGASAGGLEAFEVFFRNVPVPNGLAFILIPHLDPDHVSLLTEILQRSTKMPVNEAQDHLEVAPDNVYIIPPNREMEISDRILHLNIPEHERGHRLLIDVFFRSLAEDQGERAICVILSGSGMDGTLGLRAIHGAGGVSFVQDPKTAKYDGMPSSAVASGLATYVLPVEKIPDRILGYVRTLPEKPASVHDTRTMSGGIDEIVATVKSKTGQDFSRYRKTTILRRVKRRMAVHEIEHLSTYNRYLQEHADEVHLLFKELLINVTSFFRDNEAFAALKEEVFPVLFKDKPEDYVFRVWVPGGATGEEAYSIAILLKEFIYENNLECKVQIFSTDIDEDSIALARPGVYPKNIAVDISPKRLCKFFTKEEAGYRIKREVREMVTFAVQNVIKDPPFIHMDLISCRNLLIYLEPDVQNSLISLFHGALRPGGTLFLGSSEDIGDNHSIFKPFNKKWRLFMAKGIKTPKIVEEGRGTRLIATRPQEISRLTTSDIKEKDFSNLTTKLLHQSFVPPSVLVDEKGQIFFVHGDTGKFLRPSPGIPNLNVMEMVREGLRSELRNAMQMATMKKRKMVRKNVTTRLEDGFLQTDLIVAPVVSEGAPSGMLLVSFQEASPGTRTSASRQGKGAKQGSLRSNEELELEIMQTKSSLQDSIQDLHVSNAELKSLNEEFQSANEELQSMNEELQTSKEEMQSINEELVTINAEVQTKNDYLVRIQNDMKGILDSTEIAMIFLDEDLAVKRYTPNATRLFHLVVTDIGRPLADIKPEVIREDFVKQAREALDSISTLETRVQTSDGKWYLARVMPYRTIDNIIDGVVLTFTDVTEMQKVEEAANRAREYAENIVNTLREPLIVLDRDMMIVSASKSFYVLFGVTLEEIKGQPFFDIGGGRWDVPKLRSLFIEVLPRDSAIEDFLVDEEFPTIGRRRILLNARRMVGGEGGTQLILLAMEDVTARGRREGSE